MLWSPHVSPVVTSSGFCGWALLVVALVVFDCVLAAGSLLTGLFSIFVRLCEPQPMSTSVPNGLSRVNQAGNAGASVTGIASVACNEQRCGIALRCYAIFYNVTRTQNQAVPRQPTPPSSSDEFIKNESQLQKSAFETVTSTSLNGDQSLPRDMSVAPSMLCSKFNSPSGCCLALRFASRPTGPLATVMPPSTMYKPPVT